MKFYLPFNKDKKFPITQKFGEKYQYHGGIAVHEGVDWAMPANTPLFAPFDCKIVRTTPGNTEGYGQAVYALAEDISNNRYEALLAHCSGILATVGTHYKAGTMLATSGNTGFWRGKNGYHLHYGVKMNGKYVDPLQFYKELLVQPTTLFDHQDNTETEWLGSYTVKAGDSLWNIAEKFYKTGGHYNEIFLANQHILKNANTIQPGQLLRIPRLKDKGL